MNKFIPSDKTNAVVPGRHILISESTPGQWQLESNVPPRDVVVILLEIAKAAALKEMKEPPLVAVPQMQVTL